MMLFTLCIALLSSFSPVEASTFRAITLPQLVDASFAVVQVRVVDTFSAWTVGPQPYIATTAHLEVTRSLDGAFDVGEALFVREAGGTVNGYTIQAVGFPQFDVGQELVLFLTHWQDDTGDYRVAGYGQGIYEVYKTSDGIARLIPAIVQGQGPNHVEIPPETVVPPMTPVSALARYLANFR